MDVDEEKFPWLKHPHGRAASIALREDWKRDILANRHSIEGFKPCRNLDDIVKVGFDSFGVPKRVEYSQKRRTTDMEDVASYLAIGKPTVLGFDHAREPDRAVVIAHGERVCNGFDFHQFSLNSTPRNPMTTIQENPTPAKQFVTKNVPGFEDGHPLMLKPGFDISKGCNTNPQFIAVREDVGDMQITVTFPATPENVEAHVRVKAVKPPKVEKKV